LFLARHNRVMKLTALILSVPVAYLIVLVAIAVFQQRLLYFPVKAAVGDVVTARLRAWPSAQEFRGLVAEPAGAARATVIVFHGNAGHAGDRSHYADTLTRLGLRVILAEYPGYGPRAGAIGEQQLVDDAAQAIALAHRLHGAPLLVIGESLGSGVAAAASARQRDKTSGLLLITPWDRLMHVAGHHYRWLPVPWLLRDRYDSVSHLAAFGRPVAVVVAERDSTVPARFGLALYEDLAEPKQLLLMQGAGHNDWPAQADDAWWLGVTSFLLGEQHVAAAAS
jgi:pimeloyl-ACP methyl ester carboxylesterase